MTRYRIIVGPTSVRVERNGIVSETAPLDETHGPAEVREIAEGLYRSIKRLVAYVGWVRHRLMMWGYRSIAALIRAEMGDEWHPGPRPDLVSVVPWKHAKYREWIWAPHAVAGMLLRGSP